MANEPAKGSMQARQIAPVILMIFANFFGQNLIFPFLPFMVKDFLDLNRNEVGFYSGFLASAFHMGSFFGSVIWGAAADRFGRRPALLASQFLTMLWMLMFAFSRSFVWAVAVRGLWGLSSGIVGVGKTVLSESSTSQNTARTFSLMGVAGGLGRLLGPATGGLLVGLISDFPYAPPLLVCFFVTSLSFVLSFFLLKETLVKKAKSNKPLPGGESADSLANQEQVELLPTESDTSANGSAEHNGHVRVAFVTPSGGHKSRLGRRPCPVVCCFCPGGGAPYVRMNADVKSADKTSGLRVLFSRLGNTCKDYRRLLKDRVIRSACIVYTLLAFTAIMHNQIIPLLVVVNFAHGGLCMNSAEIGIILAGVGVLQLLVQLLLYPRLAKRFGYRRVFRGGMVGLAICLLLLPWLPNFTGNQDPVRDVDTSSTTSPYTKWSTSATVIPAWLNETDGTSSAAAALSSWYTPPSSLTPLEFENASNGSSEFGTSAQPFTSSILLNESSGACAVSKAVVSNDTDECGRPLASSGKSRTVNFELIKCLPISVWLIVFVVAGGGYLTRTVSFTSVNILINNSCEMEVRARVNGLGMSLSAIGRLTGPLIVSNVFAASDINAPDSTFTPEHHITAWLTACSAIAAALWSLKLPASIEKKKVASSAGAILPPQESSTPDVNAATKQELVDASSIADEDEGAAEEGRLIRPNRTTHEEDESSV